MFCLDNMFGLCRLKPWLHCVLVREFFERKPLQSYKKVYSKQKNPLVIALVCQTVLKPLRQLLFFTRENLQAIQ